MIPYERQGKWAIATLANGEAATLAHGPDILLFDTLKQAEAYITQSKTLPELVGELAHICMRIETKFTYNPLENIFWLDFIRIDLREDDAKKIIITAIEKFGDIL